MAAEYQARVAPWKKEEVQELTELLREHPVIGIARIDKLPSRQFQEVRGAVRDDAEIRVVKNTLLLRAIEEVDGDKPDLDELEDHIHGQTALILSDANPFKVFRTIEDNKADAPASAGDSAPKDIWVEEGETPFKPGPVVGDLQKAGLPAKIEGGAVVISEDQKVAAEGDIIDADLADALSRLDIHPMVVGLDMKAAWEDGTVFERDVLDVDPQAFVDDLVNAHARAEGLAVEIGYTTERTMAPLLQRGFSHARSLGLEASILEPDLVEDLLARAHGQAQSLADRSGFDPDAEGDEEPEPEEDEAEADASEEDEAEAGAPEEDEAEDGDEEEASEDEEPDEGADEEEEAEQADADDEDEE